MSQGLDKAAAVFDEYTMDQFNRIKQIHIILLVVSLALVAAFIVLKYRPYVAKLRAESKKVAGLLSQLPAEVDVLAQVKAVMIGIRKEEPPPSVAGPQGAMMPGMYMPPGAVYPGGIVMGQGAAPGMGFYSLPGPYVSGPGGATQYGRRTV